MQTFVSWLKDAKDDFVTWWTEWTILYFAIAFLLWGVVFEDVSWVKAGLVVALTSAVAGILEEDPACRG